MTVDGQEAVASRRLTGLALPCERLLPICIAFAMNECICASVAVSESRLGRGIGLDKATEVEVERDKDSGKPRLSETAAYKL